MQEGVDTMIIQQVAEVAANEILRMVVDDTDILVRLIHFCGRGVIPTLTCLETISPIRNLAVIAINATVDKHRDVTPDLLAAH